jgi:hypothetical protein
MTEKEKILDFLMKTIGEEGCGVACKEAEVFKTQFPEPMGARWTS